MNSLEVTIKSYTDKPIGSTENQIDYATYINEMIIFDQKLRMLHHARAKKMAGDFQFLYDHCQKQIDDRIQDIKRVFSNPYNLDQIINSLSDDRPLKLSDQKIDCLTSNLSLHWVNDLPGRLYQIRKNLKPDAVFIASLLGGQTLDELRQTLMAVEMEIFGGVSARIAPFIDMRDMGALMQRSGFALPVIDREIIKVSYDHIFKLIYDLRGMAQTNCLVKRSKKYLGRGFWNRVQEYYHDHYCDETGRLYAQFEVLYVIGWSPDVSQQKPLRPGSAEKSLAQILKTSEIKLPNH